MELFEIICSLKNPENTELVIQTQILDKVGD